MKHAAVPQILFGARVLLFDDLSSKRHTPFAGFCLNELQELLAGEIPGMRDHKVEESGFLLGVAESLERLGIDREYLHSANILAGIFWVLRTRRNLAWSCCRANM